MVRRRRLLAVIALGLPSLAGCNSLTGADDLVLSKPHHGSTADGSGGDTSTTADTSGVGGDQATGSTGSSPAPSMPDATGVSIQSIAIYQGVKRPLMENGGPASSSIPIVENRQALVRVFVGVDGGYNGAPVTARLYLADGAAPIEIQKTLGGNSTESNLDSTINFDLPVGMLVGGASYRVELKQDVGADNPAAHYPDTGTEPLDVASSGQLLKIKLVPIAYGADGSNRLPDTSSAEVERYRDLFLAIYPIPDVDVSVRANVTWNSGVYADGTGWDTLLDAIANLREQDGAPGDVYYMGIFAPASSINNYCGGGCVAGLGMIASVGDNYSHAAIGLGFGGQSSPETAVHEIGHTHGRQHAPCGGASSVDPSFPYSGGSIGVWGYDVLAKTLFSPNDTADMMGYCQPLWISDYNFKALFNRMKSVNGASIYYPPSSLNLVYDRVRVDATGNARWLTPMKLRTPPMGAPRTVTMTGAGATTSVTGQYYAYDHLDGGIVMWPQPATSYDAVTIDLGGRSVSLTP